MKENTVYLKGFRTTQEASFQQCPGNAPACRSILMGFIEMEGLPTVGGNILRIWVLD